MLWLLFGGFCFLKSKPISWATPTIAKDSADQQPTIKQFESKPIQDIRMGMRVVANNPELQGQDVPQTEIHPETYRNIRLRMAKPDGDELRITLLRSLEWLKAHQANTDQEISLSFPELGINGPAKVLAIAPCPTLETGPGRVVTGTFRHSAANVIDLYVSCEDQPIGTTANHPFWSETRQDFVQAGTLQPGEELRTATGKPAFVTNIVPRAGPHPVFNLEVDAEHVYTVASNGILVHNTDDYVPPPHVLPHNADDAIQHGLTIRNENWPWQGLHEVEGHHPLMQGDSYRNFWRERGLSDSDVDNWTVDIDKDIRQSMTNAGWWDDELLGEIDRLESTGITLTRQEVIDVAQSVLNKLFGWAPP